MLLLVSHALTPAIKKKKKSQDLITGSGFGPLHSTRRECLRANHQLTGHTGSIRECVTVMMLATEKSSGQRVPMPQVGKEGDGRECGRWKLKFGESGDREHGYPVSSSVE